ncbi:DUF3068 domain-containing protein [Micromonospora krabiensis]|uniref:DUF3068 domain-containing protein n=1 Tax=Micromonospora krabiensis TaxID=307121 RepID=A0A1C3N923_9ACTN|nr:DUF3068 domain-containing protein [Micromonospora krabiensis]SBV29079.1 Protein of unknown function [Micromonospora krabiensis]
MKRIVGATLVGLGVLLVVAAAGLPLYVAPAVSQLPYDLERSTSVAESASAEFLQIKSGVPSVERGGLRSVVEVIPQAKATEEKMTGDLEGKAVVWDVYQTVKRADDGMAISQYSTELAVERRSGAAAKWDGAWLKDGTEQPANYAGQVYKFPFGTEKKDYPVYDRDLRRAVPAQFKEVTKVRGVEVYRFEQTISEEQLPLAEANLKLLLSRFAPEATTGRLMYSNTRSFWVEPVTGSYVDLRDQPRKVLVPDVGPQTVVLGADFRYDEKTQIDSAKRAADNAAAIKLVRLWGPLGLGLLGLVAIVGGTLLSLRGSRRPGAAVAAAGTGPSVVEPVGGGGHTGAHRVADDAAEKPSDGAASADADDARTASLPEQRPPAERPATR